MGSVFQLPWLSKALQHEASRQVEVKKEYERPHGSCVCVVEAKKGRWEEKKQENKYP